MYPVCMTYMLIKPYKTVAHTDTPKLIEHWRNTKAFLQSTMLVLKFWHDYLCARASFSSRYHKNVYNYGRPGRAINKMADTKYGMVFTRLLGRLQHKNISNPKPSP